MLVCSVVLRPPRGTLAASVYEIAAAADAPSINAVFAILADDNATATDRLDAFNGQMMVEAASATAAADAGSIRYGSIVEETNAGATVVSYVPGPVYAAIAETATAASTVSTAVVVYGAVLDGTFVDPLPPATLLGTEVLDSGPVTVFEP